MIEIIISFIIGIVLLAYGSTKAIDSAKHVGKMFNISPLVMGIVVLAIGTSLPEATNSITASLLGHGAIVAGDVIGSNLVEITFVLGILALFRPLTAKRKDILLIGGSAIICSVIAVLVAQTGYIGQDDALLLLLTLAFFLYINQKFAKKTFELHKEKNGTKHIILLIVFMVLVIGGANLSVTSAIELSKIFGIPEFLIAFFIIGPGGSVPELAVSLAALRKNEIQMSVGNLLGSNITDSTLALGIGPLIAPITFDPSFVGFAGWYMVFASLIVVGLFAFKEKVSKKMGLLFIGIYLLFALVQLGII